MLFRVLCRLSDKQLDMSGCKKNNLLFQSSETFLNGRCGRYVRDNKPSIASLRSTSRFWNSESRRVSSAQNDVKSDIFSHKYKQIYENVWKGVNHRLEPTRVAARPYTCLVDKLGQRCRKSFIGKKNKRRWKKQKS